MAVDKTTSILNRLRRAFGQPAVPGVPDTELLERFVQQRDEAAFELLVWRHERMVWSLCRRVLHDPGDAEDAFQAAFLVLARKASTISRRESVAGWLYKVAFRCALKLRTSRARQPASAGAADLSAMAAPEPGLNEVERRDLWRVLDEEIQRLPAKDQAAVVLCYLEGKTYQEAAEQLGCPLGTLSARLTRARERLRQRLTARGVTLGGAGFVAVLCEPSARAGATKALVDNTIQTIGLIAAGRTALTASKVITLAEGVVKSMAVSKFKIAGFVLLVACVVGLAGVTASYGLREDGPDDSPAPVRANGVPVWQKCAQLGSAVGQSRFMRFSPDGRTLLTVNEAGLYQLWDTDQWQLLGKYDPSPHYHSPDTMLSQGFSPDGRLIALCGGVADPEKPGTTKSEVTLLDAKTLRLIARLPGAGPLFCPDKTSLVTRRGDEVAVWNARTFEKKLGLQTAAPLRHLEMAFSPDGTLLFAATKSERGHLWELKTGKERAQPEGFQPSFAADSQTLLTHLPGGAVKLWDTETGKEQATLHPSEQGNYWAEFAGNGKDILTIPASFGLKANGDVDIARRNGRVKPHIRPLNLRLWDAQGREIVRLPGDDLFDAFARPSPDGKTIGYLRLGTNETERRELVLWDVAVNKERAVIRPREGVHHFEFSPDSSVAFTHDPDLAILKFWDTATGKRLPDISSPTSLANIHISRDGQLLAASPGKWGQLAVPNVGAADVFVFRLSDRPLPPPVQRGETAKPPAPPAPQEEPKRTKAAQALADLEKESQTYLDLKVQLKFGIRAFQIARDDPRDAAAMEALEFALRRSAGSYDSETAKLREDAFALIRKEFLKAPDLWRVLFWLRYQRTESADTLLEAIVEGSPHRTVQGRAAWALAESLSEKSETAQLLRIMPELLKHPEVKDKAESLEPLLKADPDALARRAEEWWTRIKDKYADVRAADTGDKTLGTEAEHGLFALRNLALGKTAPDIESDDLDSKKFKLSDYHGKVIVLVFCGNWCGPCRQMNPQKQQLVERYADKPFALLEVNSDEDREAVKRTMAKEKLTWRCWFDGGREGPIAQRWHVHSWPTIFVLDGKGVIRYKELRGDMLDKAVEALLAELEK